MRYLYLVSSRLLPDIRDAKRTIETLKNVFVAKCVGTSPLGLIYGTDMGVPAEKCAELHITIWE